MSPPKRAILRSSPQGEHEDESSRVATKGTRHQGHAVKYYHLLYDPLCGRTPAARDRWSCPYAEPCFVRRHLQGTVYSAQSCVISYHQLSFDVQTVYDSDECVAGSLIIPRASPVKCILIDIMNLLLKDLRVAYEGYSSELIPDMFRAIKI